MSKVFEPGSFHAIQIHNFLGPIEVVATKGPAKITIRKYDFVPSCSLTSKVEDGTVYLKASKKVKLFSWADAKSCRVNVKFLAPESTLVYLRSKRGDIKVRGMKSEVTFNIEEGNAFIEGELENLSGVITKRGKIVANGLVGNVSLKTFLGSITTRYSKKPFSAELDLVSENGNVSLYLPKGTPLTGSWKASKGNIFSDFTVTKAALFNIALESKKGNVLIKSFDLQ